MARMPTSAPGSRLRLLPGPGRAAPSPLRSPPSEREGPAPLGPLSGSDRADARRLHADRADGRGRDDRDRDGGGEPGACATRRRRSSSRRRRDWRRCSSRRAPKRALPGVAARWEPLAEQADGSGFRFVGLAADAAAADPLARREHVGAGDRRARRRPRPRAADRRAAHRPSPRRPAADARHRRHRAVRRQRRRARVAQ